MSFALLDLPAPLLSALDTAMAAIGLPALLRVVLYALLSAWVSMAIYRRWSRQEELAELATATRALRQELSGYDGPFDGLMLRVRQLLRLSGRHLRLSFVPAMLGGLPLLLLLPWLSNQFGYALPQAGTPVQIQAEELQQTTAALTWTDPRVSWDADTQSWTVFWPGADQPIELRQGEQTLLSLPLAAASDVVHPRMPLFNLLIGNPAGYLPDSAPMSALRLDLPEQQLHGVGPTWLRSWLTVYLAAVVLFSLWFKWRWKLQ
jgi:hypothetical protein